MLSVVTTDGLGNKEMQNLYYHSVHDKLTAKQCVNFLEVNSSSLSARFTCIGTRGLKDDVSILTGSYIQCAKVAKREQEQKQKEKQGIYSPTSIVFMFARVINLQLQNTTGECARMKSTDSIQQTTDSILEILL